MIASFGDAATRDVWNGVRSTRARRFGPEVVKIAVRKLDAIHAAAVLSDLSAPPGNRLKPLGGDLTGLHSIRVNDQWRIICRWTSGGAEDVKLTDYH